MNEICRNKNEFVNIINYSDDLSVYYNEFSNAIRNMMEINQKRVGLCLQHSELIMIIVQCFSEDKCIIEFLNLKLFKNSVGECNKYLDCIISDKELSKLKYKKKIETNLLNKRIFIYYLENCYQETIEEKIFVYYTSGSTGRPKKVYKKEKAVLDEARAIIQKLEINNEDMILCVASCNHVFAQSVACFAAFIAKCKVVYLNPLSSPHTILKRMKEYDFSIMLTTPIYYEFLCDFYEDLNKVRLLLTGGAKLSDKVLNSKLKITNFYGSTETGVIAINNKNKKQRECVGEILDEVKIVWKDREIYKDCREFFVNSPFNAYKICEDNYENKLAGLINLHDIGYQKSNKLYIVGRTDNIVNVYGMKICCSEVEDKINKCLKVDKAVVTKYCDTTGEHIQAYVKLKVRSIENEKFVRDYCLQELEKSKIPSKIIFVNNIPYNELGKIEKKT